MSSLLHFSPRLKTTLWRWWYQFLAGAYRRKDWGFMNYGYAPTDPAGGLSLDGADEGNRYCIQMYHHVASAVDLADMDVIEIGCGRGGGADYVGRYLKPRTLVGVDFSRKAVAFCRRNYSGRRLSFRVGDAQSLPFPDSSFDAAINIESSHCYECFESFLREVRRVLRSGGYFLYSDFRERGRIPLLRDQLRRSGLTVLRETDITANVTRALELDSERKVARIRQTVHAFLVPSFLEFAGAEGSETHAGFRSRRAVYLSFVLRKGTGALPTG